MLLPRARHRLPEHILFAADALMQRDAEIQVGLPHIRIRIVEEPHRETPKPLRLHRRNGDVLRRRDLQQLREHVQAHRRGAVGDGRRGWGRGVSGRRRRGGGGGGGEGGRGGLDEVEDGVEAVAHLAVAHNLVGRVLEVRCDVRRGVVVRFCLQDGAQSAGVVHGGLFAVECQHRADCGQDLDFQVRCFACGDFEGFVGCFEVVQERKEELAEPLAVGAPDVLVALNEVL